ncbi:MAG TPA: sensor histidine kinase, partial [Ignavibacteriaceae bacterium]|nr:sensor histidine kinase [Ignavibacteriaceae bacterium]
LLIGITIIGAIYFYYVNINTSHRRINIFKKNRFGFNNNRLMALFVELDPNPLFQFNLNGKITFSNSAGFNMNHNNEIVGLPVNTLFNELPDFDFKDFILNGKSYQCSVQIKDNYYNLKLIGVPEIGLGKIFCVNTTEQKRIEEELILSRTNLRNLSNHIQKLQEEEKQKISRELHDGIGQILTSIRLNIEAIVSESTDYEGKRERFRDISKLVDTAITETKEMSYQLKPRILDDFGLVPSLNTLCKEVSKKSGISGNFKSFKLEDRLSPEIETVLFRIAQEGLNNIVKHSHAKEFNIQLFKHPGFIRLMIEDDGVGFEMDKIHTDESKQKCMGLININERAISINGKVTIDSQNGAGTDIIVEIPLEEENA